MAGETRGVVQYRVDVVGTRAAERIKDPEQWATYVRAAFRAIGESSIRHIQDEIQGVTFKNSTGRLQRAVAWTSDDWSLMVYMDPNVAPHAIWQEIGVHEHVMRYLLKATRPIPVPTGEKAGGKYPTIVHRWATERWMGVPHPYEDQRGQVRMATGWTHPGYEGKRFFRRGIEATLDEAKDHIKGLVFRLVAEDAEP